MDPGPLLSSIRADPIVSRRSMHVISKARRLFRPRRARSYSRSSPALRRVHTSRRRYSRRSDVGGGTVRTRYATFVGTAADGRWTTTGAPVLIDAIGASRGDQRHEPCAALELKGLVQLCGKRGLSGHLLVADSTRLVEVGAGGKLGGYEDGAGQLGERGQQALIMKARGAGSGRSERPGECGPLLTADRGRAKTGRVLEAPRRRRESDCRYPACIVYLRPEVRADARRLHPLDDFLGTDGVGEVRAAVESAAALDAVRR
jgi:hypothetical protein